MQLYLITLLCFMLGRFSLLVTAYARDCEDLYGLGFKSSDIYKIDPKNSGHPFLVYCDQTTSGGGWIVIQRRVDGSVNFYRGWRDYEKGFGSLIGNMWLGLEYIHLLTTTGRLELYVGMEDFEGNYRYARYNSFYVSDRKDYYRLHVSGYSGTAGDDLRDFANNCRFTTWDVDNDTHKTANCARLYYGGWWYSKCHLANPNGLYLGGPHHQYATGIHWAGFKGHYYSLKRIFLLVRRY